MAKSSKMDGIRMNSPKTGLTSPAALAQSVKGSITANTQVYHKGAYAGQLPPKNVVEKIKE